ncbi:MAG: THUMP domain-containing protein [Thermofilaceae archaeon]
MSEHGAFAMHEEGVTLCLLVSGAQPQLGAREAEALLGRSLVRLSDRLHIAEARDTNEVGEMLQRLYDSVLLQEVVIVKAISANPPSGRDFYKSLAASCSWSELKNRSFAVTVRKLGGYPSISSMELAACVAEGIIESLEGSFRVDLEAPDVNIRLITSKDAAVLGIQVLDLRGDRHRLRSKRFKVFKHPASLTPEDAGILVNLTGWRSPLIDPFCGSGTVVVEACLRGLEAVGLDIDLRAAKGACLNLALFSCSARGHIVVGDATRPPFRAGAFRAIATNPPYGRILATTEPSLELARSMLNEGARITTHDAVYTLVLPSPLNLSEEGFHVEAYPVRVHGKLTRYFTVVRRRDD